MRRDRLQHRFVEFIPEQLEEGVLYVSIEYMTVAHRCCCGCGEEVSTTLSPTDWRLIFDGKTISLEPSIGSWSLPCRSHYFITRNHVRWALQWSKTEIEAGRRFDTARKQQPPPDTARRTVPSESTKLPPAPVKAKAGFLAWLRSWWN